MGEKMNIFDKIGSIFESEDKTVSINFDRTKEVPGYKPGGPDHNLHVVQCEAYIAYLHRTRGWVFDKKDIGVSPMLCTAYIDDDDLATREMLRDAPSAPGGNAPDNMVIIANKSFFSFFKYPPIIKNAYRVAALEGQSAKSLLSKDDHLQIIEQIDVARWVAARKNHSDFVVNRAFKVIDNDFTKQNRKFSSATKREQKKGSGNICIFNDIFGFKKA